MAPRKPAAPPKCPRQPRGRWWAKGRSPGRMNGMEARYAEHLDQLRREGSIAHWAFESVKLRLADLTWYTPDFMVLLSSGFIEMHEVKGFREAAGQVKIKVAAEHFPFRFLLVRRASKKKDGDTGRWVTEEVTSVEAPLAPCPGCQKSVAECEGTHLGCSKAKVKVV